MSLVYVFDIRRSFLIPRIHQIVKDYFEGLVLTTKCHHSEQDAMPAIDIENLRESTRVLRVKQRTTTSRNSLDRRDHTLLLLVKNISIGGELTLRK